MPETINRVIIAESSYCYGPNGRATVGTAYYDVTFTGLLITRYCTRNAIGQELCPTCPFPLIDQRSFNQLKKQLRP